MRIGSTVLAALLLGSMAACTPQPAEPSPASPTGPTAAPTTPRQECDRVTGEATLELLATATPMRQVDGGYIHLDGVVRNDAKWYGLFRVGTDQAKTSVVQAAAGEAVQVGAKTYKVIYVCFIDPGYNPPPGSATGSAGLA